MLPYGNAQTAGGVVQCQHGPAECNLNMVEACGIKHLPRISNLQFASDYMKFIFCVESGAPSGTPDSLIKSCAKDTTTATAISACYGEGAGVEGKAAIAALAAKTTVTKHQYTPWLIINGKHSTAGEQNLKAAICAAYKGSAKPAACSTNDADIDVPKCFPNSTTVVV